MQRIPLFALAFLVACATHSGVTTAHPIGEGNLQGSVEPGAIVAIGGGQVGALPTVNFALRYGVSDRVDFGVRVGSVTYEVFTKVAVTDPDPSGTVVSVAPHATLWVIPIEGAGAGFLDVKVPVLVGLPVGEDQLVLAPKLRLFTGLASGGGASAAAGALLLGTGVGYSAKLGKSFRLHPEVTVEVPVVGFASAAASGTGTAGASVNTGGVALGGTLGLLFGGR